MVCSHHMFHISIVLIVCKRNDSFHWEHFPQFSKIVAGKTFVLFSKDNVLSQTFPLSLLAADV